ncbi:MAG TPA: outer membrane lipoprotein carrier protein LolA [Bacteroidales bacterium]|nr:outer membrane lipoprotein carrier protein LolA [Bacteroidales bacterium]
MKFKVVITVILVFFAVSGLKAQTTAGLMEDFVTNISQAPAIETEFVWNGSVSGTMILQGDMFYMHMDEFYVYCDGEIKYYYNEGTDQWQELSHDRNSPDILENPSAFFSRLDEDFYFPETPVRKETPGEDPVWEITLVPHSVNSPFAFVVISLKAEDLTPVYIRYALSDGSEYSVVLTSFSAVPARSARFFAPDTSN